jgi:hypothetical protein
MKTECDSVDIGLEAGDTKVESKNRQNSKGNSKEFNIKRANNEGN